MFCQNDLLTIQVELPKEIIKHVFFYIEDRETLYQCKMVCKEVKALADEVLAHKNSWYLDKIKSFKIKQQQEKIQKRNKRLKRIGAGFTLPITTPILIGGAIALGALGLPGAFLGSCCITSSSKEEKECGKNLVLCSLGPAIKTSQVLADLWRFTFQIS